MFFLIIIIIIVFNATSLPPKIFVHFMYTTHVHKSENDWKKQKYSDLDVNHCIVS